MQAVHDSGSGALEPPAKQPRQEKTALNILLGPDDSTPDEQSPS